VREVDLAAYEHQDIPFEQIVDIVNPRRSRTHHPLFQVSVVLLNTEHAVPELPGLTLALEDIPNPIALFDLALQFAEKADARGNPLGIEARIGFACDLYDRTTIEAFAIRLQRVLDAAIADLSQPIGRIDILTDQERSRTSRRRATAANGAA
jgi:non-ribosomal peptide synthetase component F